MNASIYASLSIQGVRGLYKGLTPPLIGWNAMDAVMWSGFLRCQSFMRDRLGLEKGAHLPYYANLISGGFGGLCSTVIVTPVEQIKARLQIQYDAATKKYAGPIDCARQLVRTHGFRGLYFGYTATVLFRLQMSVYFATYEYLKDMGLQNKSSGGILSGVSPLAITFVSGGLGAMAFWSIALPSDIIKNRMMASPPGTYKSITACARAVYAEGGPTLFYRGLVPAMVRAFPANGTAILSASLVQQLIPHQYR